MRGVIKRLVRNKGFGFLRGEDGIERFFHKSSVMPTVDFDNLAEEDSVTFDEDRSPKGPRAKNIDVDMTGAGDDPTQASHQAKPTAAKANVENTDPRQAEATGRTPPHRKHQAAGVRPRW